ncbi:MAG TPA: S41 family peptidase [Phycisphaerales bacterium]|nr:S41 family peptidase [Phycisphaerales bacterium]
MSASFLVAAAPPPDQPLPSQVTSLDGLSVRTWADAREGNLDDLLTQLRNLPAGDTPGLSALRANAESLEKNLAKREELRSKKLAELNKKFDEQMKKADEAKPEDSSDALSEALKTAVETFLVIKPDTKESFKHDARITDLIHRADVAARSNEKEGKWFKANELFYRLHLLLEEEGTYKPDTKRLGLRLRMIRMYAPEEFWKLRNDERLKEKKSPLPPYNGLGENFRDKLDGIDSDMVRRAVLAASRQQIDTRDGPNKLTLKDLILSGIDALRTLATTSDLKSAFPELGNKDKSDQFIAFLDDWRDRLKTPGMVATDRSLRDFMEQAINESTETVQLGSNVVLHEFGNGAMGRLDDFSAIIWPDEVTRFNRMTEGKFRGVGVQIQMDDETQMIKVVSPLEGTPAQRAGIKTNDLIKKIDGKSAVGISLDQAVDLITGPVDTTVTMTMERKTDKTDENGHEITQDIDFKLARAEIDLPSVKGWRHSGNHETDWDWMIDPANRIGYVRLLQFTDNTTHDLREAVHQMQMQGPLNGLIFDLRFDPGGLLTEAVGVANTFIDRGVIVSTEGLVQPEVKTASPGEAMLKDTNVIVLINEGSASASEIVSGAIRYYADHDDIHALVLGQRSFGKGSVQNVWPLTNDPRGAKMKLTTQYYKLPDGRILHRKPGSVTWGVEPHLKIDMLPDTESDAIKLRTDADVVPIDQNGKVITTAKTPDPQKLLDDGLDLQLQTALAILQAQAAAHSQVQARMPDAEPRR